MKARIGFVSLVLASLALGTACVDLFHGTSFDTLCDVDGAAPACRDAAHVSSDAGHEIDAAFPSDICTLDSASAAAYADHACAWLGACGGSFGGNTPGECLKNARLAYDCSIAPGHAANGAPLALWRCLATATTCDAVGACIEPGGAEACPVTDGGAFVTCASTASGHGANDAVRIACGGSSTKPLAVESCAASGRVCNLTGDVAACGASAPGGGGNICTPGGCDVSSGASASTSALHDCDDAGIDRGVDCASFGAGACSESGDVSACTPSSGSACTRTATVTCDADGGAHGCASGLAESVDCLALTGSPSCDPAASGPTWDLTRACTTSAGCSEICTNGQVTACINGASHTLDCRALGLSGCSYTQVGDETHPSCVP